MQEASSEGQREEESEEQSSDAGTASGLARTALTRSALARLSLARSAVISGVRAQFSFNASARWLSALCALLLLLTGAGCGNRRERLAQKIDWKGEMEAEETMGDKQDEPVIYVALGDSTGVGVGARKGGGYAARLFERIVRVRPHSRLVNLSVSGATTGDVLRAQVAQVAGARPTLITLGIGINDVTRSLPAAEFAERYEQIILRLKRDAPATPIVVMSLPDISYAPAVPAALRDEARRRIELYNGHVARLAERHGLFYADAYEKSHQLIPEHPEFFSSDNFHPSDEGYEFWAVLVWPTIKEAIGER